MTEKVYVLTESELKEIRDTAYNLGCTGIMPIDLPKLPEPIEIPSDDYLQFLVWEEIESEIKENDPRDSVYKYMKYLRDLIFKNNGE